MFSCFCIRAEISGSDFTFLVDQNEKQQQDNHQWEESFLLHQIILSHSPLIFTNSPANVFFFLFSKSFV